MLFRAFYTIVLLSLSSLYVQPAAEISHTGIAPDSAQSSEAAGKADPAFPEKRMYREISPGPESCTGVVICSQAAVVEGAASNPGKWVEYGRRGGPSLEYQAERSGQQIVQRGGKNYINEYELNGVPFDDFKEGTLIDYKADYSSFIEKDGLFTTKPWFSNSLKNMRTEALNQVKAAEGLPVEWRVGAEQLKAFRSALRGIPGIRVVE